LYHVRVHFHQMGDHFGQKRLIPGPDILGTSYFVTAMFSCCLTTLCHNKGSKRPL